MQKIISPSVIKMKQILKHVFVKVNQSTVYAILIDITMLLSTFHGTKHTLFHLTLKNVMYIVEKAHAGFMNKLNLLLCQSSLISLYVLVSHFYIFSSFTSIFFSKYKLGLKICSEHHSKVQINDLIQSCWKDLFYFPSKNVM